MHAVTHQTLKTQARNQNAFTVVGLNGGSHGTSLRAAPGGAAEGIAAQLPTAIVLSLLWSICLHLWGSMRIGSALCVAAFNHAGASN